MADKRRKAVCLVLALFAAAAAVVAGMFLLIRNSKTYGETKEIFGNPLMGYAPGAGETQVSGDISLLYADITWRELEPQEGVYDWAFIEEKNQLERWRKEGKHIVLRFLCDRPEEESHMDIPDWLYEKTGKQGTWYDMEYGRGFSPDYASEALIQCHEKAVAALGKQFGQDDFISYVELGSLGHWGEWHVNYAAGISRLPGQEIRQRYISPWTEAFPRARLLMRRPFAPAGEQGFGLYNDMAGEPDSTEEWLEWIQHGGDYSQTGEKDALVPMENFWKEAPAGGELTSSLSMEYMLDLHLDQTVGLIEKSHMTFLGPKTADSTYAVGYEEILGKLGYRIRISHAKLEKTKKGTSLQLTWKNSGAAPMYRDWPVYVYVEDETGQVLEKAELDIQLSKLIPGETMHSSVTLTSGGLTKIGRENQCIRVGIVDPMTGVPAVRLAMDAKWQDGKNTLFN